MIDIIRETQANEYTLHQARHHIELAQAALTQFPSSEYRDALEALAEFVIERQW